MKHRGNHKKREEFLVIPLTVSPAGLIGRQCPSPTCRKPFQVKPSIPLLLAGHRTCPYCGLVADEADFWSDSQWRWFQKNLKGMSLLEIKHLNQIEVQLVPGRLSGYQEPDWEPVNCPHCGKPSASELKTTFCPACGLVTQRDRVLEHAVWPEDISPRGYLMLLQTLSEEKQAKELALDCAQRDKRPSEPGALLADLSALLQQKQEEQKMGERQQLAFDLLQLARKHGYLDYKSNQELEAPLARLAAMYPEAAALVASIFRVGTPAGPERSSIEGTWSGRKSPFKVNFAPVDARFINWRLTRNLRRPMFYAVLILISVYWLWLR